MFQVDTTKLDSLIQRLQNTGTPIAVKPKSITADSLKVSTVKPAADKPAVFRNVKKADRKEPANYRIKGETHAAKSSRSKAASENTASINQQRSKEAAKHPVESLSVPVQSAVPVEQLEYKSLQTIRKELYRDASKLLAAQKQAEEEEQAELALANQDTAEHTDILKEIAGYDPNELQDPNKPVFRAKAGGRNKKRYKAGQTGRYSPEEDAAYKEAFQEITEKIGDFNNRYAHRQIPAGMPTVNSRQAAGITDDEVRQQLNAILPPEAKLLTIKEQAVEEIEETIHRKQHGMEISSDLRDDNQAPTPCTVIVFDKDHPEYQFKAAIEEFAICFARG